MILDLQRKKMSIYDGGCWRIPLFFLLTMACLTSVWSCTGFCDCFNRTSLEYHGRASEACTRVGKICGTCLPWANFTEMLSPDSEQQLDLEENYCRSLGNSTRAPTCYYQSSTGEVQQEYCISVPPCNVHAGCMYGNGATYRDAAMFTATGHACLRWNDSRLLNETISPNAGLQENFCRNPDNSISPWCFYLDPETNATQRDFCDIPQCRTDALENFTRSIKVFISGHNRKYVTGFDITSEECALSCLNETNFVCRSFEYRELWPYTDRKCILTNESLHSLQQTENPTRGSAIDLFTRIDTVCDAYILNSLPESCPYPIPVDLINVTASSIYNDSHDPTNATPHGDMWWRPAQSSTSEWLQMAFSARMFVTALVVQGAGRQAPYWVQYIDITYSEEGVVWWPAPSPLPGKEQQANGEANCVKTITLTPPIRAKFVKIQPTKWHGEIAMRIAVFGCLDNDCDKSAGMADGSLHDGLVTASSSSSPTHAPHTARPNLFDSRGTGWVPMTFDTAQWLRVEFPKQRVVHTIVSQGCGDGNGWVTSYTVEYASDVNDHTTYFKDNGEVKVLQGNRDGHGLVMTTLEHDLLAHVIIVHPVMWNERICMRVDFIGCIHSACSKRLGVESGQITDNQLSASTHYLDSTPQRARLHLIPDSIQKRDSCWRPTLELTEEWLQVDLLTLHTVIGVITQGIGASSINRWVTSFLIKYESRLSVGVWRYYLGMDGSKKVRFMRTALNNTSNLQILNGNTDANTERVTQFRHPFISRKIRFIPNTWVHTLPCMRVEVLGCRLGDVGEICGDEAVQHNGYCLGSVNNRQPDACDLIFSEESHPLKITSQTTQDFIADNFKNFQIVYASDYLIGLRLEVTATSSNRSFRWWDGTPVTYQNFMSIEHDFVDDLRLCVSMEVTRKLKWRVIECGEFLTHHATICQKDIDECARRDVCPSVCENFPGGYRCACPHGYFYRSGTCLEICSQFNPADDGNTSMSQIEQSCLVYPPEANWTQAKSVCNSSLAAVEDLDKIMNLQPWQDFWIDVGNSTEDSDICFTARIDNTSHWDVVQTQCNEKLPFACKKDFADIRIEELLKANVTSVNITESLGYIHSVSLPPWYNAGSKCQIHIQGPSHLVVRFMFLRMVLRPGKGADACHDSLTVEDQTSAYRILRGRYCGTRNDLEVITRSNDVTMMLHMGYLNENVESELGFTAFYEMIDCNKQSCELGCSGKTDPTGDHGTFTTPSFPSPLPPFSICKWDIRVTPGYFIKLSFPDFRVVEPDAITGSCLDAVFVATDEVFDDPSRQPGGICGMAPPLILTDSAEVSVLYWTGLQSPSRGFRAEYEATELPGCSVGANISSERSIDCDFDTAAIASPGFPRHCPAGIRYTWQITTAPATYIELIFHEFDIPSEHDCEIEYVGVYDDGTGGAPTNLVGKFCGSVLPPERIHSSRNVVVLKFRTHGDFGDTEHDGGSGFYAEYSTLRFEPQLVINESSNSNGCTCPDQWDIYNGYCYSFHNQSENLRWRDAEMECVDGEESHLVSIRNILEMEFIHKMLTSQWFTEHRDTYIGLTDAISEGHFRWTDGYPMSYAGWHVPRESSLERPQPDGDALEDCTMITLNSIHSTANWYDVSCASKDARQFICKKPATCTGDDPNTTVDLTMEEMYTECGPSLKTCRSGECIQFPFSCPEESANYLDNIKVNSTDDDFFCAVTKERISISFYCDFVHHCADKSDEMDCDYPDCKPDEYRCDNGQCISSSKHCDLIPDCSDGSDETLCAICNAGFQCYDGTCLAESAMCDAMKDCPGNRWEDEPNDCSNQCDDQFQLRCNNGACTNRSHICMYDFDEYGLQTGCRDVTHLRHCESFTCPAWTLKCPSSYCIPLRMRCDGKYDCPFGEDESRCEDFQCPGAYRCHNANFCIALHKVCDGVAHCPQRDDEYFCDTSCPNGCYCHGHSIECKHVQWSPAMAELVPNQSRLIKLVSVQDGDMTSVRVRRDAHLAGSLLFLSPGDFPFLSVLDLSNNAIEEIPAGIFNKSSNLLKLSLANNKITVLRLQTFEGLHRLVYLNLIGNPLTQIDQGAFFGLKALPSLELTSLPMEMLQADIFSGLDSLQYLSLQGSTIVYIEPRSFSGLKSLNTLDIQQTQIQNVFEDMFTGLDHLNTLYSDRYLFCCLIGEIEECTPSPDQFSSCKDLMRNIVLRIFIWVLGISALLGNALVFIIRLMNVRGEKNKVQEFLILNLAVSDFLMGVYMIIIGSADARFRDVYILHAEKWESSAFCKIAGLISVLSSEVSVIMLVVISLDRFWCVVFPFKNARLSIRSVKIVAALAWIAMLVVSTVPILGIPYFAGVFYGRTGVCLALPLTADKPPGWEFSVSFFLFFNMACFIVILVSYAGIYSTVRRSSLKVHRSRRNTQEVKMAGRMLLILCTDFLCWMPVIIMGILALTNRIVIPSDVYAWTAVLILPLNSALNPYLYTISSTKLRNRKVGNQRTSVVSVNNLKTIRGSSESRCILLSDVTRGQQTLHLDMVQLNQLTARLREIVKGLHDRGVAHGDISQRSILLLSQTNGACSTWSAELMMPKGGAVNVVSREGANFNTDAIDTDISKLNNVIEALRRKMGDTSSETL